VTEKSKIEWTHHTFNPWWGCARVSPGCEKCYAEAFAKRTGNAVWGVQAPRRFFGDKHWDEPKRWDERCAKGGTRERVFCASMADVFEDRSDLAPQRERLWKLIEATPNIDWQMLTKRPQNIARMGNDVLARCWLGTTAEDQQRADERVPLLLQCPAAVRFVSAEPLLGPVDLDQYLGMVSYEQPEPLVKLDWVIAGGESGPGARPCCLSWLRNIVHDCEQAGVACFVKWAVGEWLKLADRKGGDMSEWPGTYLNVRQFPGAL
jgi:protein gp37